MDVVVVVCHSVCDGRCVYVSVTLCVCVCKKKKCMCVGEGGGTRGGGARACSRRCGSVVATSSFFLSPVAGTMNNT